MFAVNMNSIKHNEEENLSETRNNEGKYEVILTKLEIERKIQLNDTNISVMFPGKTKSNVWNLFRIIVYKDIRQNFVTCLSCSCVLAYKSRTGTASLLRHNCYKRMHTQFSAHDLSINENNETLWNNTPMLQNLIKTQNDTYTENDNTNIIIKCEPEDNYSIYEKGLDDGHRTKTEDFLETSSGNNIEMGEFSGAASFLQQQQQQQQNPDQLSKFDLEEKLINDDKEIRIESPQKMKSDIWKRFKVIYYKNLKQNFVRCVGCSCILSYKKKTGSASLIRHKCNFKRKILPILYGTNDRNETSSAKMMNHSLSNDTILNALSTYMSTFVIPSTSTTTTLRPNYVPKERLTELAMNQIYFICKDLRPIEIFDNLTFREMMQALINIGADFGKQNIDNVLANGTLIKSMLSNMRYEMQEKMKIILTSNDLSFTFDLWHREEQTFLTVIGYVITEDFEMRTLTLGTRRLNTINEISVRSQVVDVLSEYVKDTDAVLARSILVVDEKQEIISKTFQNNNKIICSCHKISSILEIIINIENNFMHQNLIEIDKLITYLKGSDLRQQFSMLTDYDNTKTWDSQLVLLDNVISTFDQLTEALSAYSKLSLLENIDISLIKSFYNLLRPFQQCLDRLSSDERTTLNEVYLWKKKLEKHCQVYEDDTELIKEYKLELSHLIEEKFDITDFHKVALFMDPKFKNLKFLTQMERESVIESVKTFIDQIILERKSDVSNIKDENDPNNQDESDTKKNIVNDLFLEFMDCSVPDIEEEISKQEIKSYIDTRLNEPKSTLEFWKIENSYPNLRRLVRSILNIPACSISNKLKFSINGKLLKERRTSIKTDDLNCILFLNQNI